jgi:hypothetical protein
VAPETEKPVPETDAALMVTAAVPVEVKVSDCVTGEFNAASPKAMLVELMLSVGDVDPRPNENDCEAPPALAVRITVVFELTEEAVAVKLALVALAGTVTEAGTVTSLLLLARLTANPPLAAAEFSVAVQLSVPAPVIDPLAQVNPLSTGTPVPLRLMAVEAPVDELLAKVSEPVAAPAVVGSN